MMPPAQLPFAGGEAKFFNLQKFGSINTKAKRPAIGEEEFSWVENMMPVGDGNLQALYSNGTSIYTAPGGVTIIYFYFFNISATNLCAIFLSDGTAVQVNTDTLGQTTITSNPGQFFPGSSTLGNPAPACAQFGNSGLIIVTTSTTNGYYAWDGTTLYSAGQSSPSWLNGGSATTMPSGISGTCVETFLGRVWVGNGSTFSFSAPGNGASFSGSIGGGSATSSDSFLKREFTQIKQANGFLYLFADSSVNVVSNVQSSGSPITTTFNNQNVDPQTGTPWHNSVQSFGRGLVFGSDSGVFALVGGAAEKVSDALDGIFNSVDTFFDSDATINQPSAAIAVINNIKIYMLLMPVLDPFTQVERRALVMWDGKKWWIGSQDVSLTFINSQEINSEMTAYGTNGTDLYPLFQTSSNTLRKIWQTKLWQGESFAVIKKAMRLYTMAQDNSGVGYTFTGTLDYSGENTGISTNSFTIPSANFPIIWQNASLQTVTWTNASAGTVTWTVIGLSISGQGINISASGSVLGLTMQSTSPDFTLVAHSLLYQSQSPLGA